MGRSRKKERAKVKLQLEAGKANPAPPVGRDLGPHGVNLVEFCKQYNCATREQDGAIVPVVVTVYEDRTFSLLVKTPTTAYLLRRAAGVMKGSGTTGNGPVGSITHEQLREIAGSKMPDLNASSLETAMKIVEGSARSMGIEVSG